MSGLDQASCAGDKSSVLISPDTLKTVNFISSFSLSFVVNHLPSAQFSKTFFAKSLLFASSLISLKASKISKVFDRAATAASARFSFFKHSTRGVMLYPPSIVPSNSTA